MTFIIRHGHWGFAAAIIALITVAAFGDIPLDVAAIAIGLVTVALLAALFVHGLVTERAGRHLLPADDPDDFYFGAVTGGDTLSRRSLREIGRRMALDSRASLARAVNKSKRRHERRLARKGGER